MKYGLIGEHLGHSFSKIIHEELADYEYEICEIAPRDVGAFMTRRNFLGINVTIPYKETVIPYLDYIDEAARKIGAVNTVVNRDGVLCGYNTDYYGMISLFSHAGIDPSGKKVAILGTGGTSKCARAVLETLSAKEILVVSRHEGCGVITYEDLYEKHRDTEIILNTTPVGMYPRAGVAPVDISKFERLLGVIDAVYNPLNTRLITEAKERGIKAEGGLYMLVAQARRASEIFLGTIYEDDVPERIYRELYKDKENIVLIGMPSSGKSSVGKRLSEALGRELLDTDALLVQNVGKQIPEIFKDEGEERFRDYETEAVSEAARVCGVIIATGGGAILRRENVLALKGCGRLYFIDRPLECLMPTSDRPLSSDRAAIEKRYNERYSIYTSVCDVHIDGSGTVEEVTKRILEAF